jgi:2'-5' RNA ligase
VPRLRLGVALLVPRPDDVAVNALRAAVGDPALNRIPAHLTLVPPVNVREDRLDDALAVLRRGAAEVEAFTLQLGSPVTFLPVNPVLYLPVTGGEEPLNRLREAVFTEPLARPLSWPFVPHVTLADEASPERIFAAQEALADFRLEFTVASVHLLREGPDRRWQPIADANLGPPAVVGRGGLELSLTRSEQEEPGVARMIGLNPFCITARRAGKPVGQVAGFVRGDEAVLERLAVAEPEQGQGVGTQLVAAAEALAAESGCVSIVSAAAPGTRVAAFLAGRGWAELRRALR